MVQKSFDRERGINRQSLTAKHEKPKPRHFRYT